MASTARANGPLVSIREVRKAYGLSIPQLVERILQQGTKVDPDHISNVELGHKRPSQTLMVAWARALDIVPLDVYVPEPVKKAS